MMMKVICRLLAVGKMDFKLIILSFFFFFSLLSANDEPIFTHLQTSHYWSLFKVIFPPH